MNLRILFLSLSLSLTFLLQAANWTAVDSLVNAAVADSKIPGAVVAWVTPKGAEVRAYGYRQVVPDTLPMTASTQFDLASLSKVTGTGMAIFRLIEEGRVVLTDSVQTYLPDYRHFVSKEGQVARAITVQDILTHTSGLPAYATWTVLADTALSLTTYASVAPEADKRKQQLRRHVAQAMINAPGEVCRYSCLNFITLQYIVEAVTGMPFNRYVEDSVFRPLGMKHTCYYPLALNNTQAPVIAPTEYGVSPVQTAAYGVRTVVHDPLAREMNAGISGNAGVFSTADDLVRMAKWILCQSKPCDKVLRRMQQHGLWFVMPEGYESFGRALAWDRSSDYSSCKGTKTGDRVICHTGYTGTSFVVDPDKGCALIILTNRVHPSDGGGVSALRKAVADVLFGE